MEQYQKNVIKEQKEITEVRSLIQKATSENIDLELLIAAETQLRKRIINLRKSKYLQSDELLKKQLNIMRELNIYLSRLIVIVVNNHPINDQTLHHNFTVTKYNTNVMLSEYIECLTNRINSFEIQNKRKEVAKKLSDITNTILADISNGVQEIEESLKTFSEDGTVDSEDRQIIADILQKSFKEIQNQLTF